MSTFAYWHVSWIGEAKLALGNDWDYTHCAITNRDRVIKGIFSVSGRVRAVEFYLVCLEKGELLAVVCLTCDKCIVFDNSIFQSHVKMEKKKNGMKFLNSLNKSK